MVIPVSVFFGAFGNDDVSSKVDVVIVVLLQRDNIFTIAFHDVHGNSGGSSHRHRHRLCKTQ